MIESLLEDRNVVSFDNFHDASRAVFTPIDKPSRKPDFSSKSGSLYWDTGIGVIRCSDHWVGFMGCRSQRSCEWSLEGLTDNLSIDEVLEILPRFGNLKNICKRLDCSPNLITKIMNREVKKITGSLSAKIRYEAGMTYFCGYCDYSDFEIIYQ